MLARLRAMDPDAKRVAFTIAGLYALVEVAGLTLGVITGEWGLAGGAAALAALTGGLAVVVAGLWRLAVRLFPDTKR